MTIERKRWTERENLFLRRHKDRPSRWCGEQLGRTGNAVDVRRNRLGIAHGGPLVWTKAETDFLRRNADRTNRWIAEHLAGRTVLAVSKRRARLKLGQMRRWTEAENALVLSVKPEPGRRADKPETQLQRVARELGRTVPAVYQRRIQLLKAQAR